MSVEGIKAGLIENLLLDSDETKRVLLKNMGLEAFADRIISVMGEDLGAWEDYVLLSTVFDQSGGEEAKRIFVDFYTHMFNEQVKDPEAQDFFILRAPAGFKVVMALSKSERLDHVTPEEVGLIVLETSKAKS